MQKTFIDYMREELRNIQDSGKEFDRELLYFPDLTNSIWRKMSDANLGNIIYLCTYKSERFLVEKNLKEKLLRFYGLAD